MVRYNQIASNVTRIAFNRIAGKLFSLLRKSLASKRIPISFSILLKYFFNWTYQTINIQFDDDRTVVFQKKIVVVELNDEFFVDDKYFMLDFMIFSQRSHGFNSRHLSP